MNKHIATPALALLLTAVALAAGACGTGDKTRSASAPQTALTAAAGTATALAPTATPRPAPTDVPSGSSSDGATGSVLPLLFGDALSGGAPGALGEGDPALKQYLLQPSELPDGFTVMETSSQQVRDGISSSGTADIATLIAADGNPESGNAQLLMSMAMHFSDLQDLDKSFSQIDSDALTAQLGGAGLPSGLFKDVKTLPTDGLGDHATGFSLTMDFGQFLSALTGALGGDSATPVAVPSGIPSEMRMQMYVFARGSYAGAVMAISYGDTGAAPDLLPLAKLADGRLATAP